MPLIDVTPLIKLMGQIMIDTVKIERITEEDAMDPATFNTTTGRYTAPTVVTLYQGQCSVGALKTNRPTVREAEQGGALSVDIVVWLTVPLSFKTAVLPKDRATIMHSNNPLLVGEVFTLKESLDVGTYSVARRFLLHRYVRVPQ